MPFNRSFSRWDTVLCGFVSVAALLSSILYDADALVVIAPENFTVFEFNNVMITCNATGYSGIAEFLWTRIGYPEFQQYSQNLTLRDVFKESAGIYTCNVRTTTPQDFGYANTTLIIHYFPRTAPGVLQKFAGHVGESGAINCIVLSLPNPTFYWQDSGNVNLTGGDYSITTEELSTTVVFSPVKSSHYGTYFCKAANDVGTATISIQLLEPGIPDSPRNCTVMEMTAYGAWLQCIPSYDGGADLSFKVYKSNPYIDMVEINSNVTWMDGKATVYADGLEPNENYTLHIYCVNQYGDSDISYGVYVRTADGPPILPESEFPMELVVICASVGGFILVVIATTVVCIIAGCCKCSTCCQKKEVADTVPINLNNLGQICPSSPRTKSPAQVGNSRNNVSSYFAEDSDNDLNLSRDVSQRFERQTSWASFKDKKKKHALDNPGYMPDSQPGSLGHQRPADYSGSSAPAYSVRLNHFPGESSDMGVTNLHYSPAGSAIYGNTPSGSGPSSLSGSQNVYANVAPGTYSNLPMTEVEMRRKMADPVHKAKRISSEQPDLAGLGALVIGQEPRESFYSETTPYAVTIPTSQTQPQTQSTKDQAPAAKKKSKKKKKSRDGTDSQQNPIMADQYASPQKQYPGLHQPYASEKSSLPSTNLSRRVAAPNLPEYAVPFGDNRQVKRANSIAPLNPGLSLGMANSPRPPTFIPEVEWEFPREKLSYKEKIGEGSFGEVWRAKATGILQRPGKQLVAVKMLKDMFTPDEKRALLKELQVMKQLQPHPNIVSLLGCCTDRDPILVIMEHAANGNLQDLLRRQRSAFLPNDLSASSHAATKRHVDLTSRDLAIFALHVATGMEYITAQQLLHRDLAARNILVDSDLVCKICDFGSARDIMNIRQYESTTQRRLPIRWMAPESLFNCEYSFFSDIWAFGVVLWEIVTLGSSPYPGMSGPDVMTFVQKGCRMAKPKFCSHMMYKIMQDCWSQFPPKRPAFIKLKEQLSDLLKDNNRDSDIMFVDQMSENVYDILRNQPGEKC